MRCLTHAGVWLGAALLLRPVFPAETPLTKAADVKRLSAADVAKRLPVALRGVVTQVFPEWDGFSLQDASEGIYVGSGAPLPADIRVGESVAVEGRTAHGNFAPAVRAENIRILGPGQMPRAERVYWRNLATGDCDNEYVEVRGVVRSVGPAGPPAWEWRATALRLDIGGNLIWAYLRAGEALPREPLVDATVRVRGVCVIFANSQRQFQGSIITLTQPSDLQVLQPGPEDQFEAPLQPIRRLFGFNTGSISFHRVKVEGVATLQIPGGVYLQQGTDGVLVRTPSAPKIRPGDRVEAVGFPAVSGFSTVLEDGLVRVTGRGPEPSPRIIPAGKILERVANVPAVPTSVLVRVEGRILDRARSAQEEILTLVHGETRFTARLHLGPDAPRSLAPGAMVAVTGVCIVQLDDRGLPQSFDLLMRSPQDAVILERPPWLSRQAALRAAITLLAFLVAAAVWLMLLRRRVARQTKIIRGQFDREASLAQRYTDLVENASDLVYVRDLDGRLLQVNRGAQELTGYSRRELLDLNILDLLVPAERERARKELTYRAGPGGSSDATEWRFRTKDGRELIIETKQRFLMENGRPVRVECIGRDVTARQHAQAEAISERNRLEEQLHHSQRLESIGQLAGGVAHDFNNLLTVISGYAQLVLDGLSAGTPLREPINEIARAADRAGALTRQLLLFSRREKASPRTISLNDLVGNLEKMLRRLIGEHIELTLSLKAMHGFIRADPGHIEQVVMNLAVNARDAMPDGGSLTLRTADFHADRVYADGHLGVVEGDYVALEVTDSGVGMDPEVRARIFEPFFTTKEQGRGTGLGLSMVYGIVKQSGGAIFVDSDPGRGARFEILFPAVQAAAGERIEGVAEAPRASGAETILVTEDEAGVRTFISDVLRSHGYSVLEAANGREALQKAAEHPGPIHLLLTDVVMPEMGGMPLAERFAKLRPGTPVLHMSGYMERRLAATAPDAFIEKPFTPAALLARIRAILDRGERAAEGGRSGQT